MNIPTVVAFKFFNAYILSRYTRNVVQITTYDKLINAEGTTNQNNPITEENENISFEIKYSNIPKVILWLKS